MENLGIDSLLNLYRGKKVLLTGHTGFKGSWLAIWLEKLGADVVGVALDPKTEIDNFNLTNIGTLIKDIRLDIRDKDSLIDVFLREKPNMVFHLAAQPLVLESYENPIETFETNTQGTTNILEAIRHTDSVEVALMITTDKVYHNEEWVWPYKENDRLGGYDPYSASKGASEIIIASYRNSFFNSSNYENHRKSIASVRAGNVIGGGDWSKNRIIPDCIKSIEKNIDIEVRSPKSVRPWQHVLEPLFGYIMLGAKMFKDPMKYSDSWNFGPEVDNVVTVERLVSSLIEKYGSGNWLDKSDKTAPHEAKLLALDINKAKYHLNWNPALNIDETIDFTVHWYKNYKNLNVLDLCRQQIDDYYKLWKLKNEN